MLEQLLIHIDQHKLCERSDKILLAVSGGIDSIVLMNLFQRAGFSVGVAHCNFQLRDKESDEDERFVRNLCRDNAIPFHVNRFDTKAFAEEKKISIQVAARNLRYAFFDQLIHSQGYTHVATAHHHNDSIETIILNLIRGTGIDGLTGIRLRNGRVIRPLLWFTRQDIVRYAVEQNLEWREDSSNKSDDYQRNFLRHNIIPLLKSINANFEEGFKDTIERLQGAQALSSLALESIQATHFQYEKNEIWMKKSVLTDYPFSAVLLWEVIKAYGFRFDQCKQMATYHQAGKKFFSPTHQLTIDREYFIITELSERPEVRTCIIHTGETQASFAKTTMEINEGSIENFKLHKDNSIAHLDLDKLRFPLTWRFWQSGDFFHPLGMNHSKKLSDFFIDLKIPLPAKEDITVLESDGDIAWVIGLRIDDRFKVSNSTKRILTLRVAEV